MRSMQLLIYRADEQLLEVRARDFKTHLMTAVAVLDDDTYLGAENSYNLFTLRKNADAASDEDRNRLEVTLNSICSAHAVLALYCRRRVNMGGGALAFCALPCYSPMTWLVGAPHLLLSLFTFRAADLIGILFLAHLLQHS